MASVLYRLYELTSPLRLIITTAIMLYIHCWIGIIFRIRGTFLWEFFNISGVKIEDMSSICYKHQNVCIGNEYVSPVINIHNYKVFEPGNGDVPYAK